MSNEENVLLQTKLESAKDHSEKPSFIVSILIYLGFYILIITSTLSALIRPPKLAREKNRDGYPPLYDKLEAFLSFYLYGRVRDCTNTPVCSVPGVEVVLKHRTFNKGSGMLNFSYTGEKSKCTNLGSYNYLGFAENSGKCVEYAIRTIYDYGISTGATRQHYGTCDIHVKLEKLTAEFLGVEDALCCGMGFATNSLNLPAIISRGCLVLSDEKNHISLIVGVRISGATVRIFKHNNAAHLEQLLKEAVCYGQDTNTQQFKPWKKIFIIVEGIYSMEGTLPPLPEIIALKNKYKAYLYLDEAHSIGAMGKTGRGAVEYLGCNPQDVDILMGTYTKSFGAVGGFISGKKEFISCMRRQSYASKYSFAMSPPVAAQVIEALNIIMGKDGTNIGQTRIATLARNTKYFRRKIAQLGLITYGCEDSPVVPILSYFYSKIAAMIRILQENKIATIGVGYPATPFLEGRMRICLSAGHTKDQLDYTLSIISKVANQLGLKYSRLPRTTEPIEY